MHAFYQKSAVAVISIMTAIGVSEEAGVEPPKDDTSHVIHLHRHLSVCVCVCVCVCMCVWVWVCVCECVSLFVFLC